MARPDVLDGAALDALTEMTGGDPAFLAELIDTYLADAKELRATMRQALAAGDAPELRRAAHSLKSNSATFGAATLAGLCHDLEERGKSGALDGAADLLARVEATSVEVEAALLAARPAS
jgi:HPt (histidine-containing phosphotransfer) domain-containing protein